MSYASNIKTVVAKHTVESRTQIKAELSALVRACGSLIIQSRGRVGIKMTTENSAVARLIFVRFKKIYKRHAQLITRKNRSLKKHNLYDITLDDAREELVDLAIVSSGELFATTADIPAFIWQNEANQRAYIRGMFLGAGSVSDPEKSYHLEFVSYSEAFADSFASLLSAFDLSPKVIARKNQFVIYFKEAEQIVDILNIIGAHRFLLSFENTRIIKAMRNKANRMVNCDTANLNKTITAAQRQVKAIQTIQRTVGLASLPDNLAAIADVRLANPAMSLVELGQLLTPAVGKSGVSHRLKKLETIADAIGEEHE